MLSFEDVNRDVHMSKGDRCVEPVLYKANGWVPRLGTIVLKEDAWIGRVLIFEVAWDVFGEREVG